MSDMTFVELFAGVGGMSRGLEMAGWRCVGHAEWDDHARAVLRRQWPEVPLWGDVSQLNGHDLVQEVGPFTMLTFGAPCQDFSIAGKRSGMDGERSVLVLDALRIWEESQAPFALYENVVGMLSSNKGEDFAAILSVFVGDAVAVPARGWRGGGGVVRGRRGVAAWRVLDAQYFGVPQRRRRVFVLGVRGGGVDPAEVLSLFEGVSGNFKKKRTSGQAAPADTGASAAVTRNIVGPIVPKMNSIGFTETEHLVPRSLDIGAGVAATGAYPIDTRNATRTTEKDSQNRQGCGIGKDGDPSPTLTNLFTPAVLTYDARGNGEGVSDNTLSGDHQNRVTDYTAIVLRNREGKPGGGKGPLLSPERSLTLGTANDQVVFPTITMGAHPAAPGLNGQDAPQMAEAILRSTTCGVPRRLTPVECERLMGWPDGWTAQGLDAQGRPYALSDTARYKACGNGVASPVAAWIGFRLREALTGGSWEVTDA